MAPPAVQDVAIIQALRLPGEGLGVRFSGTEVGMHRVVELACSFNGHLSEGSRSIPR